MKKTLIIIILMILFMPVLVSAESFNKIRISAVFTGSEGSSNVDKIYVRYRTFSYGVAKDADVTLTKTDKFIAVIPTTYVDDIKLGSVVAMTKEGVKDIFGFLHFEIKKSKDLENDCIEMTLVGSFDSHGFDGQKYRGNSEVSSDDLNNIKKGQGYLANITGDDSNVITYEQPTTSDVNQKNNNTNNLTKEEEQKQQRKEERNKSINALTIILASVFGVVAIIIIFTLVKIKRANDRV